MSKTDEVAGRVCMRCGKAIADDDRSALMWAEGGLEGVAWQRWFHRECVDKVNAELQAESEELLKRAQRYRLWQEFEEEETP